MSNGEPQCEHPIELWVHGLYARDNGSLNDYYDCGLCGELMQVG